MITTIDSSLRVFMVTGDNNRQIFCNMTELEEAFLDFDDKDSVQIFEFWNSRASRVSLKKAIGYLKTNQLQCDILSKYAGRPKGMTNEERRELKTLIGH